MNRNQKIALGCGGLGCLGLIVVVVVCVILAAGGYIALPGISNRNSNYNSDRNSNYNSNVNQNSNTNSSSSSFSDDDKHKLLQAAAVTKDQDLMERVLRKLAFITGTNTVSDDYAQFLKDHLSWARKNYAFIRSVNTPEKGRAYVEAHIND
ncbi:MAG TPA: hypothetical protein VJT50_14310 [Pyrinomonadaceae bacterium]|nr:hypothetical protein [Pyrinomonadaceae bacterium]